MQNNQNPKYLGTKILSEIDSNLVNYSNNIVSLFLKELDNKPPIRVVDFGAGTGTLAAIWKLRTGVAPECVEIDPILCQNLRNEGFISITELRHLPGRCDLVYSSNVLEHIEDDVIILKILAEKLSLDGKLLVYVPAHQLLFSDLDRSIGHYRRYGKLELVSKLQAAGFQVEKIEYSDSLGFLATFILKMLGFSFESRRTNSFLMKIYDRYFVPVSIKLDRVFFKNFFGKNLYAVAVRSKLPN